MYIAKTNRSWVTEVKKQIKTWENILKAFLSKSLISLICKKRINQYQKDPKPIRKLAKIWTVDRKVNINGSTTYEKELNLIYDKNKIKIKLQWDISFHLPHWQTFLKIDNALCGQGVDNRHYHMLLVLLQPLQKAICNIY